MQITAQSERDFLHEKAALLLLRISKLNSTLLPLVMLPMALESGDCFLSVKVLNKTTNACIGSIEVSGLVMKTLVPILLEIIEGQGDNLGKKRAEWQRELTDIELQLRALGTGDNGEGH